MFNEFLSNLSSQAQILHIKYPWLHVHMLYRYLKAKDQGKLLCANFLSCAYSFRLRPIRLCGSLSGATNTCLLLFLKLAYRMLVGRDCSKDLWFKFSYTWMTDMQCYKPRERQTITLKLPYFLSQLLKVEHLEMVKISIPLPIRRVVKTTTVFPRIEAGAIFLQHA